MRKSILSVVACLSLAVSAGCGEEQAREERTEATSDGALRKELTAKVNRYAWALLAQDEGEFSRVTTAYVAGKLQQANASRRVGLSQHSPLGSERAGLLRVIGGAEDFGEGFTVTGLEQVEPDVVAVQLAFKGQPVPKPFFFVREGGEYKANVKPPRDVPGAVTTMANYGLGWGKYRVDNRMSESKSISCTPYGNDYSDFKTPFSKDMGPNSSFTLSCVDNACPGSPLHDGANFHPAGIIGTFICAYQTFGADFIFSTTNPGVGCAQDC